MRARTPVCTMSLNLSYAADCLTMIFGMQLFSESPENGGHGWSRRRRGHPLHPAVLPKVEQPSGWFFS